METKPRFAFLKSTRFWQLALIGLATGLTFYDQTTNWITALNAAIGIWFGGSVLVGTVDRASEQKVKAAQAVYGPAPTEAEEWTMTPLEK